MQLARRIQALLAERPVSVYDLLRALPDEDYRTILQAWGDVRTQVALVPDAHGHCSVPRRSGPRKENDMPSWDDVIGSSDRTDIHLKYGDVRPLTDVLDYLGRVPRAAHGAVGAGAPATR
jgi:hypothetical protein